MIKNAKRVILKCLMLILNFFDKKYAPMPSSRININETIFGRNNLLLEQYEIQLKHNMTKKIVAKIIV